MESFKIESPPWTVAVDALYHFDALERLIALGQTALEAELTDLHQAMDEDYATFESPFDEDGYLAHVNDEYIQVSETLPYLFWYSQFLITFSFFERALNALCMSFQKQHDFALSLKDMSGQGIFRAKLYLAKVCGVTGLFQISEWNQVALFAEIRNAIAHANGCIAYRPDDKASLYSRLVQMNVEVKTEVADQDDARIILDREFVSDSIKVYREVVALAGGLERNFVTPKHGLPSSREAKLKSTE